ncbi:MFS transporter [Reticulibacter mediterranei]|uniref:MFS transporter n=1 Tax=Reticulibacter mediterranei TaxID=2778369 RepID=A0A8J3IL53_9CHLR|nr:MFS transporter [Reticulibacter mediterranei]GHO94423.1 MFS transporter [Reticulibacter mediterranei]
MSLSVPSKTRTPKRTRLPALPSSLRPLADKNFGVFWAGAFLSSMGFWIQNVGQGWQVLQLTNSALLLGLVAFAATLPNIIFSLIGGVVADRLDRRRLLIWTQVIYMLTALLLGIFTTFKIINVWHILAVALINGVVSTVGLPAWQTFVGDLVPPDQLKQGIALNSTQFNLSRVIGPAVGGLSVGLLGIAGSYYLNALSYVAVIIPLVFIRPQLHVQQAEQKQQEGLWHSLRVGLDHARQRPVLQILLVLQLITGFLVFPYLTLLPIFADSIYRVGATGLGLLNSAAGIGALGGSLLLVVLSQRIQDGARFLLIVSALAGVACLAFALVSNIILALPLLALLGATSVLSTTMTNTAVQTMVPENVRARVLSLWILIAFGLAPFGNLCAGWIAQSAGAAWTLGVGGAACMLGTIIISLILSIAIPAEARIAQS